MHPRPLDLLDLPTVYRYRRSVLPLDSAQALTRGNPLGPEGLLAYLDPTRHVYTAVAPNGDQSPLVGSVAHTSDETFARLVFLAPQDKLEASSLPALLEHLSAQAARWGVFHILAEVDEHSAAFQALRQAGFAVYAWQRIWDLSAFPKQSMETGDWQKARSLDLTALQGLYHHIIPAMLQPVEALPKHANGLACHASGDLNAYACIVSGPLGQLLRPLIHPDASQVGEKLAELVNSLPRRTGKPVYLCVRSYQAWLEPVLEELGASVGPRQAVMVKHLVRTVKDEQSVLATQPAGISIQPSRVNRIETKK